MLGLADITPRRRVGSIVVFLLLAVLAMQAALTIVSLRGPKPGRFLPLAGNPYLLLDTATGTECLRVQKNRAQEMPNWLLYTERDKDVQDSYTAAIIAYAELKKSYQAEYDKSNPSPQDKQLEKDPLVEEARRVARAGAEAEKRSAEQAEQRSKKRGDALDMLLDSVDSIPVCSTR